MGVMSARESWAMSRPLIQAEIDRNDQVAAIVHTWDNVALSAENITRVWQLYADLEAADPIMHLRAEAHERHIAAFPG